MKRSYSLSLFFVAAGLVACGDSSVQQVASSAASSSSTATSSSSSSGGSGGSSSASSSGSGGGESGGNSNALPEVTPLSANDATSSQHEPQVVAASTGRIVVAWNSLAGSMTDGYHITYAVSDDKGASWSEPSAVALPTDNNVASNVTLSAKDDGTIWMGWGSEEVTGTGVRSNQRVLIAKLASSDTAFETPLEVTDPTEAVGVYDQPAVTVTPSGGLLVTYGTGSTDLQQIWMTMQYSDDDGATWTKSEPLKPAGSGAAYQNLAHPCVAKGSNHVYLYLLDDELGLALWRSDDGGKTFAASDRIAIQAANENGKISGFLETNCVAEGDDVWALYSLSDQPSSGGTSVPRVTGIQLAHSADAGVTIATRAPIEDAAVGPYYLLPKIALEDGGALDVTYYAGTAEGDKSASYRFARAADAMNFSPSIAVLQPLTYELSRAKPTWFGDYMGLTWRAGFAYGSFVDNSSGASHIQFFSEATP